MARAVFETLGSRIVCGFIVAPETDRKTGIPGIEIARAGHPVPDRRGVRAAQRILEIASSLKCEDLLIILLSGGASSLLPMPVEGLTLADKQRTTRLLLGSGATIAEINTVRKHLSAIKGGHLAAATQAQILTLLISDVGGDDVGTIGSGPTAPDRTTFSNAAVIVRSYGLWGRLPVRVRVHLVEGMGGWQEETPKSRSAVFRRVHHVVVGNNRDAVEAAGSAARTLGYDTLVVDKFLSGEASEAGQWMGEWGRDLSGRPGLQGPLCVLAGGELTVTVRGKGKGGRAQEFALAAALKLHGARNVWAVGFGTDGCDGPTDVAGAVADGGTLQRAKRRRLEAADYLKRNDSYHFFKRIAGHILTGSTGTNVNDLYLILINPPKRKQRK